MKKLSLSLCSAVALPLLLMGCPPGQQPVPLFDTSGVYAGTWSGTAEAPATKQEQRVDNCPITIELTQNVNAPFPQNFGVNGTVTVDYSCLDLPEGVEPPANSEVAVFGLLTDTGGVNLLSGACGTGFCIALGLEGTGADDDQDGLMEMYDGKWTFSILLAGIPAIVSEGTFMSDRVPDEGTEGELEGEGEGAI